MNRFLAMCAGLIVLALPALSQAQNHYRDYRVVPASWYQYGYGGPRLSPDDQRRFDSYYSRWLEYRRTNNGDEIASMEKRMQDIYQHYGIPAGTPYGRIATNGQGQWDRDRDWRDDHGPGSWGTAARLSSDDQRRFDSYYSRWQQYRATNNLDEVRSMEGRMRDIYVHYNIPPNTPFGAVASGGGRY